MSRKLLAYLRLAFLTAVPITLLVLPSTFFDEGESICISKMLLDAECPGCGITRGIMHLVHFDFQIAWDYNKLSFIVFPALSWWWGKMIYDSVLAIRSVSGKAENTQKIA